MRVHTRGIGIAIICLGLSVGASTAGEPDDSRRDGQMPMLSGISEPVSLVLLATGLGLSARGLRRRPE
jgi:hypothetical protein